MKKIGITGGIGSGKSIVCEVFKTLGVPVYNADTRAKILLAESPELRQKIIFNFGEEVYFDGVLDRKLLADKVFHNPDELKKLNDIIHPAVFIDFENWCNHFRHEKYIIKEAAILFESGASKQLDGVILVYAPLELRIERVVKRDHTASEKVLERIRNQMPEEEKKKLSDFLIYNDEHHSVIEQVLSLHQQFISE